MPQTQHALNALGLLGASGKYRMDHQTLRAPIQPLAYTVRPAPAKALPRRGKLACQRDTEADPLGCATDSGFCPADIVRCFVSLLKEAFFRESCLFFNGSLEEMFLPMTDTQTASRIQT